MYLHLIAMFHTHLTNHYILLFYFHFNLQILHFSDYYFIQNLLWFLYLFRLKIQFHKIDQKLILENLNLITLLFIKVFLINCLLNLYLNSSLEYHSFDLMKFYLYEVWIFAKLINLLVLDYQDLLHCLSKINEFVIFLMILKLYYLLHCFTIY